MNDLNLIRSFAILHRTYSACFASEATNLGLSYSEAILLVNVAARPGTNQDALVVELAIDKALVARTVKTLVDKGLITKNRSDVDRREVQLSVAEHGTKTAAVLETWNGAWLENLLGPWSDAERREFESRLALLAALSIQQLDKVNESV